MGRCGWKGRANGRLDVNNHESDEGACLSRPDGQRAAHRQAGDQANERIGGGGRIHTQRDLQLDISTVRDILNTEDVHVPETSSGARGMAIGETTVELVNACSRLMDLLDAPQDIPFFGKLIQREIIYRLLQGTQGQRLRAIATLGDQSHRTAKAVAWLRANYQKPLRVEQLATVAGMGRSTLHHHFRALTAMSPLQFQKQLRLRAARQHMLTNDLDAASAAFEVGYESASQFNREYRRFFGHPPIRDIKALRDGKVVAITAA